MAPHPEQPDPAASSLNDGSLISFNHCGANVFARTLPEVCPRCRTPMSECRLQVPPIAFRAPFHRARDHPTCLVVRPANGDFVHQYQPGQQLHVGLTDASGRVIHFDRHGVQCHVVRPDQTSPWDRSIVLDFTSHTHATKDPDWPDYWDLRLMQIAADEDFSAARYDQERHNCFDFALAFVRSLKMQPLSADATDKVAFCTKHLLPKTIPTAAWVRINRKLNQCGGVFIAQQLSVPAEPS